MVEYGNTAYDRYMIGNLTLIDGKISVWSMRNIKDDQKFTPVPLTPELLNLIDPDSKGKVWDIKQLFDVVLEDGVFVARHESGIVFREVEYIHQLQNICEVLFDHSLDVSKLINSDK